MQYVLILLYYLLILSTSCVSFIKVLFLILPICHFLTYLNLNVLFLTLNNFMLLYDMKVIQILLNVRCQLSNWLFLISPSFFPAGWRKKRHKQLSNRLRLVIRRRQRTSRPKWRLTSNSSGWLPSRWGSWYQSHQATN